MRGIDVQRTGTSDSCGRASWVTAKDYYTRTIPLSIDKQRSDGRVLDHVEMAVESSSSAFTSRRDTDS